MEALRETTVWTGLITSNPTTTTYSTGTGSWLTGLGAQQRSVVVQERSRSTVEAVSSNGWIQTPSQNSKRRKSQWL